MLCSPLIDRWQQMNSPLSLWANQTLRFTYSTDCVLQQGPLFWHRIAYKQMHFLKGKTFVSAGRSKCLLIKLTLSYRTRMKANKPLGGKTALLAR